MENPLNNGGISDSQFMDEMDDDRKSFPIKIERLNSPLNNQPTGVKASPLSAGLSSRASTSRTHHGIMVLVVRWFTTSLPHVHQFKCLHMSSNVL